MSLDPHTLDNSFNKMKSITEKLSKKNHMIVSAIVAMGKNFAIGLRKDLPWRLPSDLKRFKDLTLGHHLIMGRKTFESIGRPLPHRDSIIITRNIHFSYPDTGVFITSSLREALLLAERRGESEVFICGGGTIYQEALSLVERLYLTLVDYEGAADTFFPPFDHLGWKVVHEEFCPKENRDTYSSNFKIYERVKGKG